MTLWRIFLSALALVLGASLAYLWLSPAGLKTSPDISVFTIDGEQLALSSLRGKPLLVTFWATTCSTCVKEIPHLSDLYRELSPYGLQIIGIAMYYDPPNRVLAMRRTHNIPYTIALDIHADAANAFGNIQFTPTSFLIGPDGRVAFQKNGAVNIDRLRREIVEMLDATREGTGNPA
jgi:peroxiredoxin